MKPRRPVLNPFAAAGLILAVAGPVLAQPNPPPSFPPFPALRSLPAIATWARRNTDLQLDRIVGVGADSVFAVERSAEPGPAPAVRAVIRQEAITPEFAKRLGGRSAAMVVDIDCTGRRVFQREVDLYVGSNRQGASRQLGAAKDWQPIPPGTYMDRVMAAVCDAGWRPLYAGEIPAPVAVAAAPPPVLQSTPIPAPPRPAPPSAPPRAAPPPALAGSGRVELGLFESVDAALAAWRTAQPSAPGRRLRIELTVDGRQTLYRALVEGFSGPAEAEAVCRALTAAAVDCAAVN